MVLFSANYLRIAHNGCQVREAGSILKDQEVVDEVAYPHLRRWGTMHLWR